MKGDKNFILLSWGYNLGGLVDELVDVVLAEAAVTPTGFVLFTATTRIDSDARPGRVAACCARNSTERSTATAPSTAATNAIAGAADPPPSSVAAAPSPWLVEAA